MIKSLASTVYNPKFSFLRLLRSKVNQQKLQTHLLWSGERYDQRSRTKAVSTYTYTYISLAAMYKNLILS